MHIWLVLTKHTALNPYDLIGWEDRAQGTRGKLAQEAVF